MIIYHKSNCSTSLEAVRLLRKAKYAFEIREYLVNPPSEIELKELVKKLGCTPFDLVRQKENIYKENYAGKKISGAQWIKILSQNPILIERPIVISDTEALIGRPPSLVVAFAKKNQNKKP